MLQVRETRQVGRQDIGSDQIDQLDVKIFSGQRGDIIDALHLVFEADISAHQQDPLGDLTVKRFSA